MILSVNFSFSSIFHSDLIPPTASNLQVHKYSPDPCLSWDPEPCCLLSPWMSLGTEPQNLPICICPPLTIMLL